MAIDNLFAAEALLLDRLQDKLGGLKTIASANEIAGATDIAALCDAVIVLPGNGDVTSAAGDAVNEDQTWQIVIAVAHYNDSNAYQTTAIRAGEYANQIFRALLDYRLAPGIQRLRYISRGQPFFSPGYAEFPLFFNTKVVFRAS